MAAIDFPATRWSLIARLPEQPQQAAVLVGLYAEAIGGYLALRLAGERAERIEDVVQEVLLELLGKPEVLARAEPGQGSRFRYYLMNLAWRSALNHLRHARRRDHPGIPDDAEAPPGADQLAAMDRAWALSVLRQALDEVRRRSADGTLEPEAFAVLRAHLVEGRGLREIGAGLGCSAATCSRRLARARTLLRQAIAERLRLAGELRPGEDEHRACTVLLEALAG